MKFNEAHVLLEKHLKELGVDFVREHRFHPKRQWRLDYWLGERVGGQKVPCFLAVEIEGAIWSRGRHTRGKGYENDMRKYNAATMLGYRVLRFSTEMVLKGEAKDFLKEHLSK